MNNHWKITLRGENTMWSAEEHNLLCDVLDKADKDDKRLTYDYWEILKNEDGIRATRKTWTEPMIAKDFEDFLSKFKEYYDIK